jgi:hypothetical protein
MNARGPLIARELDRDDLDTTLRHDGVAALGFVSRRYGLA